MNTNLMKGASERGGESLGGEEECSGFVCALGFVEDRRKRNEGIRNVVGPQMRMNGAAEQGRERERKRKNKERQESACAAFSKEGMRWHH